MLIVFLLSSFIGICWAGSDYAVEFNNYAGRQGGDCQMDKCQREQQVPEPVCQKTMLYTDSDGSNLIPRERPFLTTIQPSISNGIWTFTDSPFTNTLAPGFVDPEPSFLEHIRNGYNGGPTVKFDFPSMATNIVWETRVRCQQTGVEGHPFGDAVREPNEDVRLANCQPRVAFYDADGTEIKIGFFLSNRLIYTFFSNGNVMAKPIARRSAAEWMDLKVTFDVAERAWIWSVNGYDLEKRRYVDPWEPCYTLFWVKNGDDPLWTGAVSIGGVEFTTTNMLNGPMPNNFRCDPDLAGVGLVQLNQNEAFGNPITGKPMSYVAQPSQATKLWGQGMIIEMDYYSISYNRC
eukprot:NODE_979_length_1193_cov_287.602273_g743_i0.p1 GENE.NODE_979_length_1193_cov_287.602273_g743_i0~~NODE_979_length_1193_cov_287.602273_g743_i0.p1  ORF type:complete len:365 (-),score=56.80 NODE_979_length_1193_cov_287.602273_g743_i0:97-1140(-)